MKRVVLYCIIIFTLIATLLVTLFAPNNAEGERKKKLERFEGQTIGAYNKTVTIQDEIVLKATFEQKTAPTVELEPARIEQNRAVADDFLQSEVMRLSNKYGVSQPLVEAIIFCESGERPHVVGTDAVVGKDIGYWQINTYFHTETSQRMGLDIYDPADNLEYGFWLLSEQGTQPWSASEYCWS